jgi:hypothetical protein
MPSPAIPRCLSGSATSRCCWFFWCSVAGWWHFTARRSPPWARPIRRPGIVFCNGADNTGTTVTFTASSQVIQSGIAAGRFFCGNLTLFCHLTGTPFQPDFSGGILLIEDQGEAPYRIDRMLTQMMMAGCFDGLAGLALGAFTDCGSADAVHRIVADRLGGLNIPILAGFDVGHETVNMTLPVGLPVQLDTILRNIDVCGTRRAVMVASDEKPCHSRSDAAGPSGECLSRRGALGGQRRYPAFFRGLWQGQPFLGPADDPGCRV